MDIKRIPPRTEDGNVRALIEIPTGSRDKYEYDHDLGVITFNRALLGGPLPHRLRLRAADAQWRR